MASATILKIQKSRYLGNGLTDWHSIWSDDAYWPSEPDQQLKLIIQDGVRPLSWKIEKVVFMDIIDITAYLKLVIKQQI